MRLRTGFSFLLMASAIFLVAGLLYYDAGEPAKKTEASGNVTGETAKNDLDSVDLTDSQLSAVKIESAVTRSFRVEREVIGSIAYHDKEAAEAVHSGGTKFAVADVPESDSPLIRVNQPVTVQLIAYPGQTFSGKVSALGVTAYDAGGNPAIDPNTHRITVRCAIADATNELYPGMLASIVIEVGKPVESVAVPQNGVAREGDGTMTAWVTADRKRFEKRTVKVGLRQDGYDQILEGLKAGELVATDGALFIDNALTASE